MRPPLCCCYSFFLTDGLFLAGPLGNGNLVGPSGTGSSTPGSPTIPLWSGVPWGGLCRARSPGPGMEQVHNFPLSLPQH